MTIRVAITRAIFFCGTVFNAVTASGNIGIVPEPSSIESRDGVFVLEASTSVLVDGSCGEDLEVGRYLAANILPDAVIPFTADRRDHPPGPSIMLTRRGADAQLGAEGYELEVGAGGIVIRAPGPAGLFWGVQTLRQLVSVDAEPPRRSPSGRWPIPFVRIIDKPCFKWRGMLLDCSRHFLTVDFIERYIDLMAFHKLNRLHWHLCDDQGWTLQIRSYPALTEIGAWRGRGQNRYGGFYTQEDVRRIVRYARSRFITVVPEIEMPGHCTAALAAYPDLSCTGGPFEVSTLTGVHRDVYCAGNERTFEFIENVLGEVLELFDSPYIHIGADECPVDRWEKCPKCLVRVESENLDGVGGLHAYFVERMAGFLKARGRRVIGWDEILSPGLAKDVIVQVWHGEGPAVAAAQRGHEVIFSPTGYCYLDYTHQVTSLEKAYSFEPVPPGLSAAASSRILGGQANMWTDHAAAELVDSFAFPRLCALAESFWSPVQRRHWEDFRRRIKSHYLRLDRMGVRYYRTPVAEMLAAVEPSDISSSRTAFTWDIAGFLKKAQSPSEIFIVFVYDKGADGLMLSGVELLENGRPVDSSFGELFLGWPCIYRSYRLSTAACRPDANYRLRAVMRGDGEAEAWATAWISTEELPGDIY